MTIKQYFVAVLAIIGIFAGGYATLQYGQGEFSVGSDAVTPIAGQTYTLAGAGIASSDTSFTLTSFTITQTGYKIQDSDMSETFYVTFEPGSRSRQEIASCTTVVQNSDGTATISGCTRGLLPITPYTASTSLQFAHAGGSTVIFSDPPQLFNQASFKDNDETITGSWLFPTPLADSNAATKAYVDALVSGTTTLSNDRLVVAGTAGETLATSTLVYLNPATQRWNGVSTASTTTFDDRFIGLTQGSGTNGSAVTNGVLLKGRHTLSSGLTAGGIYYASTATGTINTATSAQPVGVAVATNILYFDPVLIDVPHESANNTFIGLNTFNSTTTFNGPIVGATRIDVFTSSSTWTKPTNAKWVEVIAVGGGGGGGGSEGAAAGTERTSGSGGGGGAVVIGRFQASSLPSTVNVFVGAGGTGGAGGNGALGSSGTAGASSSFGVYITAYGGGAGAGSGSGGGGGGSAGVGGAGSGSNSTGGSPATTAAAAGISGQGAGGTANGNGSAAEWGGGAGGGGNQTGGNGSAGGCSLFAAGGGGGGGGVTIGNSASSGGVGGGTQCYTAGGGGAGGASNGTAGTYVSGYGGTGGGGAGGNTSGTGFTGGAGGFPGGGGGAGGAGTSIGGNGGNGATGQIIVITY